MSPIFPVTDESIAQAADLLKIGNVIALPTETVYGLGANGFDESAIRRIYEVKKRPPTNPLIFHVRGIEQAKSLVKEWTSEAQLLAEKFWPGPMTLVLKVRDDFDSIALAGGRTIALRCPDHPATLKLLKAVDLPIPAPSANLSETLSPVSAQHVWDNFGDEVPMILDGGECFVGLESTVLSLVNDKPEILRPGILTRSDIENVLGKDQYVQKKESNQSAKNQQSPGQHSRHYSPKIKTFLFRSIDGIDTIEKTFVISFTKRKQSSNGQQIVIGEDARIASSQIYQALWKAQSSDVDKIYIEVPQKGEAWNAIRDRLSRAVQNPELLCD